MSEKPRVLIGSLTDNEHGPIHTITRAIIGSDYLVDRYSFRPHKSYRARGNGRLAQLNLTNGVYFLKHYARWCAQLMIFRPDIAHYPVTSFWNSEKALLFLRTASVFGARTIGHLHGGAYVEFWKALPGWRRRINRAWMERLDLLIVASEFWRRQMREVCGFRVPIAVVPNPISPAFEQAARRFDLSRTSEDILFVGRMDEAKGIMELLEAFDRLAERRPCRLILAGHVFKKEHYERFRKRIQASPYRDRISLRSGVSDAEKRELFRASSVFVLPSHHENFPLVTIEAAVSGLPMVLTPVGALPDVFGPTDAAVFCRARDADSLVEALAGLMDSREARVRFGQRARAVYEDRLSRESAMRELDACYRRVTAPSGRVEALGPEKTQRTGGR